MAETHVADGQSARSPIGREDVEALQRLADSMGFGRTHDMLRRVIFALPYVTRPSLPAPGREETNEVSANAALVASKITAYFDNGPPSDGGHCDAAGGNAFELLRWAEEELLFVARFLALSRPPENVDHRATEPAHPVERGALEKEDYAAKADEMIMSLGCLKLGTIDQVELRAAFVKLMTWAALSPSSTAGDSDTDLTDAEIEAGATAMRLGSTEAELERLQVRLKDAYAALRCLAEGNLGSGPGQADYATIKIVARHALPEVARIPDGVRLRSAGQSDNRIAGATDIVDEAACLIWAELCPGMVMGDADRPHYENAAKAVLALPRCPVECFTLGPKIAVADSVPEPWKVVLAWVSDPAVAIHNKMCIAWRDDSKQKAWWSGLPQSYIRLEAERWNVTHWAEIGAPQSPAGSADHG